MVFPSVPIYLDPLNWPQQSGGRGSCENNGHQLLSPPPPSTGGSDVNTGSIKSDYTSDRARAAKISHPEAAMKCPRCESTNTKFCYFNNYSLTQPRHFCKTCRRYWTRGGALRNVPVGGGCRRNKRTGKGSRSRSPAAAGDNNGGNNYSSTSTSSAVPPAGARSDVMMTTHFPPQHLPDFLTHLSQNRYGGSTDMAGLSFGGVRRNDNNSLNNSDVEFQMNIGGGFAEQWRLQQGHHQYPFLNGMEAAPATATGNIYAFEHEIVEPPESYSGRQGRSKALEMAVAAVKEESNNSTHQGLNLSRNFLGISGDGGGANQHWGGAAANAWTELAGFTNSSSSTRHIV